ncbi:trimeric LpxA-like protein [Anaeromyces robustus]|uniref:Dynactin subunit 5 n=1 Tax=Anaeromyces robustus TaxID=1754192 RepID=A0A1Y1WRS6_9FUNG|nr:trimeric LpxA-like protein [Anaeromyces robustus]|eukprot:ORX76172.1 trimeric LpxA-like protein [Anaeromyces robustus]
MEEEIIYYDKSEYIETDSGNKISRKSVISVPQNIVLGGKTIIQQNCIIRGDLRRKGSGYAVVIGIGKYCLLGEDSIIRPPYKIYKGVFSYYPMKISDYVHIGQRTIVEAARIGQYVIIGNDCVIGRFSVIKEYCRILDNTVIPPNTVIPSFSVYGGNPGRFISELPESSQIIFEQKAKQYYDRFIAKIEEDDKKTSN